MAYYIGEKEVSYREYDEWRTLTLIKGYEITGFRYTSEGYPEIKIEFVVGGRVMDTQYLLISMDAEGNGPGEFFIEKEETV